ncbi:MAG: adenylate/guanylate cyclase domain-containing protein [Bdellovibrionota bacterium]
MNILKKIFKVTPFRLSLAITLASLLVSIIYVLDPKYLSFVATLSQKSLDYKFHIRGNRPAASKIVIVAGDEKSFQTFGQWPFDRGKVFAPLIDNICRHNPLALGFDIVWSDQERLISENVKGALSSLLGTNADSLNSVLRANSGDVLLAQAVERCKNRVVLGYALQRSEEQGVNKAEFNRRLQTITESGNNKLSSLMRGRVRFARDRGDAEANVRFYQVANGGLLNVPSITPQGVAQGFFNNEQDGDGNYRHGLLFFRAGDAFVSSLTLRMAQKALDPRDSSPHVTIQPYSDKSAEELKLDLVTVTGKREVPIDLHGLAVVNYRGPNFTFPNVSMADVISDSETIEYDVIEAGGTAKHVKTAKSELFKDALVLVGITALGLYDIRPRPLAPQASGVENHANILDNLIRGDFLTTPTPESLSWILPLMLVLSLVYGAVISRLDAKWGAVFAMASIAALLYLDQVYLFNERNTVFFGYLQAIQFLFQYLSITVLKYMREENEKKFIRSAFDKYVSPAVINSMLEDPSKLKLGGDKKELSVLFSDIRGFTELSERIDVKTLTQFLNDYLGAMTEVLQSNKGTLDKYIGDAVMGFWGAPLDLPTHASLAVKTAVEMVLKLEELNAEFQKKYGLTIDIGIGVNSGAVSVGNFGSNKVFEYTVIGDNVNLASRLESINKYYGTHIIISESTYNLLKPNEFLCREVDTVKVKGKHKPVKIYEVFPDNPTHVPLKEILNPFHVGLKHYYQQQWEQALNVFQSILRTRNNDKPTLELIERCKYYLNNPPGQQWDGSWEMHSK